MSQMRSLILSSFNSPTGSDEALCCGSRSFGFKLHSWPFFPLINRIKESFLSFF